MFTVKGKITDIDGLGFDEVKLKISSVYRNTYGPGSGARASVIVNVNPDGTFESDQLIGKKITVDSLRDSRSTWYIKERIHADSTTVALSDKSTAELSLTMKKAVFVKGKATGPDGSPQPNVGLRLNSTLVTDENGEYSGYFRPGLIHGQFLRLPKGMIARGGQFGACLLYTSPSPRDKRQSRMPSSA